MFLKYLTELDMVSYASNPSILAPDSEEWLQIFLQFAKTLVTTQNHLLDDIQDQ